jgi:hypothetical protein
MGDTRDPSRRELAAIPIGALAGMRAPGASAPAEVTPDRQVVDLRVGGGLFAVYNFDPNHAAIYRPFFYPVMGPNGKPITQNGEFPGSLRGHYWHRSLFVAHQKVNDLSFWEEVTGSMQCGRIVHLGFDEVSSGNEGRLVERLAWRGLQGEDILLETRIIRLPASPAERRVMDIGINLTAARDAELRSTPYNLLACRVVNSLCPGQVKRQYSERYGLLADFRPLDEGGAITNSEGHRDDQCRGARARWCDFSGPLGDGAWGGVALLDHPANPRHPSPWHNWNNMTITASPTFHEPLRLKKGEGISLTYRVLVHAGDARTADVEEAWKAFSQVKTLGA